jgi:hypothetical protein
MNNAPLPIVETMKQSMAAFGANAGKSLPTTGSPWLIITVLLVIVGLPTLWLYNNFWRLSSGELPKDILDKLRKGEQ